MKYKNLLKISNLKKILDDLPLLLFKINAFFLPIFFIPSESVQIDGVKFFLFFSLAGLSLMSFFIKSILDKKIILPNKKLLILILLIPLTFLISAIFSNSFIWNMIGDGYETTSVLALLTFSVVIVLSALHIRSREDVFALIFLFGLSYLLIVFYQILKVFVGVEDLSFSLFKSKVVSLTGRINDLAILSGAVLFSSLLFLSDVFTAKRFKVILYFFASVSLSSLLLINFDLAYILIFFVTASILFFDFFVNGKDVRKIIKKPLFYLAILTFILSCLSILSTVLNTEGVIKYQKVNNFYNYIPKKLGLTNSEVRPGFKTSYVVAKNSLEDNTLLGVGSNSFSEVWLKNKPLIINESGYWNTLFLFSLGYITTLLSLGGLLGIISIFSVLTLLVRDLIVNYIKYSKNEDLISKRLLISVLFYMLLSTFFYVPTLSTLFVLMILLGIYFSDRDKITISFKKLKTFKKGLLSFTIVSFFILFLWTGVILINRYVGSYFYGKSILSLNVNKDLDLSEANLEKAIFFYKKDYYFKSLSEINLLKAQTVYSKKKEEISDKEKGSLVSSYFKLAKENSLKALDMNRHSFYNYIYAAETLSLDKSLIKEASDLYKQSRAFNPNSPTPLLGEAKIKLIEGDTEKVKDYIAASLNLKSNFTEALLAAADVSAAANNATDTANFLLKAYYSDFSRFNLLKNISEILYSMGDINGAISILEAYVNKSGNAEGLYNLAILYTKANRHEDAVKALNLLTELDKKNKKITDPLVEILKNKEDPFIENQQVSTSTNASLKKETN